MAKEALPPEWAVEMVTEVGYDYSEELERLRQRGEPYEIGSNGLWYRMHARLLASVRQSALCQAAKMLSESKSAIAGAAHPEELIDTLCAMIRTVAPSD